MATLLVMAFFSGAPGRALAFFSIQSGGIKTGNSKN